MVAPNNRTEEFYSPSPREQCCNCSQPLEPGGARYWGRVRVCQHCYQDELEWQADERRDFGQVLLTAGRWAACVALAACGVAVCICLAHDEMLLALCCMLIVVTCFLLEGMLNHGR